MKNTILFVVILLSAATNYAVAKTNSTLANIEAIFWLNGPQHKNAILYARFINFDNLVGLISNAADPDNLVESSQCTKQSKPDRLMLYGKQENQYLLLMDNCIRYQSHYYKADTQLISKYRAINKKRINRGELIDDRALKLATQRTKPATEH